MRGLRESWNAMEGWMLGAHVRNTIEADERASDQRMRMKRSEVTTLLAYFVALLVSYAWLPHLAGTAARVAVALLPMPPIVLLVALSVRRVLLLDELERRIELVALAVVATTAWLGLVTCWLLQRAGMPVPSALLGFCGLGALYGFARRRARRHYA